MKNSAKNLPPIIKAIINLFSKTLPARIERLFFLTRPRVRNLRNDFKDMLCRLFDFLIRHMDLESGILIRQVKGSVFVPVTILYIAKNLNVCEKTVERIFKTLKNIGILNVLPQRRTKIEGNTSDTLICHSCSRYLTPRFFELCGLLPLFISSRQNKPMDGIFVRSSYRTVRTKKKRNHILEQNISSVGEIVGKIPISRRKTEPEPLTSAEMIEHLNRLKASGVHVSSYLFELASQRSK